MIGPVETALKAALAPVGAPWPIRWANGVWEDLPAGYTLADGDMPTDSNGKPAEAIEAEVIASAAKLLPLGRSADGKRTYRRSGVFRVYLFVAQGDDTDAVTAKADAIEAAFLRKTLLDDRATGQKLVMEDANMPPDPYEDGNRFVVTRSIAFDFHYRAT